MSGVLPTARALSLRISTTSIHASQKVYGLYDRAMLRSQNADSLQYGGFDLYA